MAFGASAWRRWWWAAGLVVPALLSAGCSPQPYESGYRFYPRPAVVDVLHPTPGGGRQTPLTALVTVVGVRRADPNHRVPHSVAVRLLLENNGPDTVVFDPGSLELVTGSLRTFPPPRVRPAAPITLAPNQRQPFDALFPFPGSTTAASFNLDNLRLRWRVTINGQTVPQSAYFQRQNPDYTEDAYDSDQYWVE